MIPSMVILMTLVSNLTVQPPSPALRAHLARAKEEAYRASRAAMPEEQVRVAEEIDVRRYDIDLTIDPEARLIRGSVGLAAEVVAPISALIVHMNSSWLTVDSVSGPVAGWTHQAHLLSLQLDRSFAAGERVDLAVFYHGSPLYSSFGIPFFDQRNGVPLIATLSEPFGARNWWPCKDQPDDKADTVSMTVTVPSGLTVASNGRLVGIDLTPNGRTHRWIEEYPIATYLVSLAISDYVAIQEWYLPVSGDSVPVIHYLYSDLSGNAGAFAVTVPAMGDLASRFGPYPFPKEKYGHALFPWGGAMEHQTCTTMGEQAANGGWEWIIVHELAHQWWGDLVTCASFHHIWLNEGFATYSEALWQEVQGGMPAYHAAMAGNAFYGGGTVYVEDPETEDIFHYGLSYMKGAYVLHMLRHVVGDSTFFDALLAYRERFAYASATTDGFRQVVEDVSARDLGFFFDQWIYGSRYPTYEYGWSCDADGSVWKTSLRIRQSQTNTGLFTMPVDVRLTLDDGTTEMEILWTQGFETTAELLTDGPVTAVELDPDNWVLCRKTEVPLRGDDHSGPTMLTLQGPWPNPSPNGASLIAWAPCSTELVIADLLGRTVMSRHLQQGRHAVRLDLEAGAGVYLVRLVGSCGTATRTMVIR